MRYIIYMRRIGATREPIDALLSMILIMCFIVSV